MGLAVILHVTASHSVIPHLECALHPVMLAK